MRALLGAIVGLAAGVAIVAALGASGFQEYWPIIVAGVAAGLIMKIMAGGPKASYLHGGLAAVATVASLIFGQTVAAKVIQSKGVTVASAAAPKAAAGDGASADGAAEGPVAEAPILEGPLLPEAGLPPATIGKGRQSDINPLDIGFLVVGCLVAYQLGKGAKGAVAPVEAPAEEGETAADEAAAADAE